MNIAQLLANTARSQGEAAAICIGGRRVSSYRDLATRTSSLAGALRSRFALEPGERVAVVMTNTAEYVEALFGIWWAGLIAVPINARLHPREIAYILTSANARLCLTNRDLEDTVAPLGTGRDLKSVISVDSSDYRAMVSGDGIALCHVPSDHPAWLFYTSGTTGRPKGAMLSHRNLMMMPLLSRRHRPLGHAAIDHYPCGTAVAWHRPLRAAPRRQGRPQQSFWKAAALDHEKFWNCPTATSDVTMFAHADDGEAAGEPSRAWHRRGWQHLDTIFYGGSSDVSWPICDRRSTVRPAAGPDVGQGETPNDRSPVSQAPHARHRAIRAIVERLSSCRRGAHRHRGAHRGRGRTARCRPARLGEVLVRGDYGDGGLLGQSGGDRGNAARRLAAHRRSRRRWMRTAS